MYTISLEIPPHLGHLVEAEAERRRVSKSAVIRACVEEVLLKQPQAERQLTCADLMGDLMGSQPGPVDASSNKRYLAESLLKDYARGRTSAH
jgi:Arc/MetJ-type ribon-helix-helix transcriptional regulator